MSGIGFPPEVDIQYLGINFHIFKWFKYQDIDIVLF